MKPNITLRVGFDKSHLAAAVALYDEAFAAKFSLAIPHVTIRRSFFYNSFSPENCICAEYSGEIIGLVGFQLSGRSFTGGTTGHGISWRTLRTHLGLLGAFRALVVFAFFERKGEEKTLLLDGIAVKECHRGAGVGRILLHEVIRFAIKNDCRSVRLDVIESNPRAKALYEKVGFRVQQVHTFPYLKQLLGFGKSYTMIFDCNEIKEELFDPNLSKNAEQ